MYFVFNLATGVWRAFVTMLLWNWFIAAPFNLPVLNLIMAYVMVMLAMLFTAQVPLTFTKPTYEDKVIRGAVCIMWPAFVLLIGWILTFFGN